MSPLPVHIDVFGQDIAWGSPYGSVASFLIQVEAKPAGKIIYGGFTMTHFLRPSEHPAGSPLTGIRWLFSSFLEMGRMNGPPYRATGSNWHYDDCD
jgi:hypothetical protein